MPAIADSARLAVTALRDGRAADSLAALAGAATPFAAAKAVAPMDALLLGQAQLAHERFPAAVHTLDRGLEAEDVPPAVAAALRSTRAAALTPMLRFEQAARDLELAAATWSGAGATEHLLVVRVQEAVAAGLRGDADATTAAVAAARELLDTTPDSPARRARECRLAALDERDPERRVRAILRAGGPDLDVLDPTTAVQLMGVLVRALQAAGRRGDAEQWVARMSRRAAVCGLPLGRARVRLARAELQMATGNLEGAAELALLAAEAADRLNALADALEARLLAARGLDDRAAERELVEVVEIARDHRAERLRRAAVQRLRDLGVTVYDAPVDPATRLQRLTDTERQVMDRMLADAPMDDLGLTQGAIERHVSAVLNKLGARSRDELRAFAARVATS